MTTATNPFRKTLPISNRCSTSFLHFPFNLKSLFFSRSWKPNKLPLSLSLSSAQISSFSLQKPTLSSRLISCVSRPSGWEQEGPSAVLDKQGSDSHGPNWGAEDFGVGGSEDEVSNVGAEDDGKGFHEPPRNAKLYVGNLPFDVDGATLARIFQGAGVVEVAEVICRRHTASSQIFGFVTMSTIEEAKKALEMFNSYELNGRMLLVEKAIPRGSKPPREFRPWTRIYVGNLPWDVDSDRLNEVFSEHGKVLSAYVVLDEETRRSLGFGFVNMASEAEMNDAISALDGQELNGRILTVNIRAPKGSRVERPPREFQPSFRIVVANLPWDVDGTRLKQVFSEHGKVLSARVVSDRETGRSRGFGFVDMASETEMNDAVSALDGQTLGGRAIRVSVAEERPRRGF